MGIYIKNLHSYVHIPSIYSDDEYKAMKIFFFILKKNLGQCRGNFLSSLFIHVHYYIHTYYMIFFCAAAIIAA